jgi:hypothetical protein
VNFPELIQTILIYALPVVFAITLHEAAHGYVANKLGDNTALMLGRVTLNPIPHIDPLGTIAMPALLYFATGGNFLFGYARPVPVRFGNLNHPKRDMIWVALAKFWRDRNLLFENELGRCSGQRVHVRLQPLSSAAARWWPRTGRRATLACCCVAIEGRALWHVHHLGSGGFQAAR